MFFVYLSSHPDRLPLQKGKCHIKIHEDASGSIYTVGMTTRHVTSLQEVSTFDKLIGYLCHMITSTADGPFCCITMYASIRKFSRSVNKSTHNRE